MTIDALVEAIEQTRPILRPEDVDWFEREIGYSLPKDYRAYLMYCSGGYPAEELAFPGDVAGAITHLNGLEDLDRRLLRGYSVMPTGIAEVSLPIPLLPIASTDGGDYICICLSEPSFGGVYYIDHDSGGLEIDRWSRDRGQIDAEAKIADSFREFVTRLTFHESFEDDE